MQDTNGLSFTISSLRSQMDGNLLSVKTENHVHAQAQTGWYRLTLVPCTNACAHVSTNSRLSSPRLLCRALRNLLNFFDYIEDMQFFWQSPLSSFCLLLHRYQLCERNPTSDLHFPYASEMHKKAACPFHFWHIHKTRNAAIPIAF